MFEPGTRVIGTHYTNSDRIQVRGTVISRTDDPEENYQAYYIEGDDGNVYCSDEQETWKE